MGIFMLYLFYVICLFSVENGFEYDKYVTNVTNSTASFRKSIFGSSKFFFIDILMLLWTAFINGIVIVLFILCFKRIVEEYTRFNVNLQKLLENQENDPNFVLIEIESHHNNLLDLIKFNNEEWTNLTTHTFLTGFVMQIMCAFLLKSFSEDVNIITKVMMFSYTALGIMLAIIATKLPSDVQTKLIETQDIILSNPILGREQSEKIISSVDIIIRRLQKPTLSMYIMNFFKLTPQFQAGAMLLFGILIEFFSAYKKNSP